jgi:hypothetical protein
MGCLEVGVLQILGGLLIAGSAWAQAPAEPAPASGETGLDEALVYNYDKVLVATLQPLDEGSEAMAQALFAQLLARFQANNDVVPMSAVPRFEPHEYGGELYLESCPADKYTGCALIVGQRAEADWVVGGTVQQVVDDFDPTVMNSLLTVTFVDVRGAREVARFGLPLIGDSTTVIDGIARVYDDIVQGDYELRDLRGQEGDPEAVAELDEARKELVAQSLSELESVLGEAVRSEMVGRIEAPRLTKQALAEYEDREERSPWDRVGMTQSEYLRFANSGRDLKTWRALGYGRLGQIIVRAAGGGGGGPFNQTYEGQLLQDGTTLATVQTVQYVEVTNASGAVGELELGFGVLPFLDVTFVAGARTGRASVAFDHDVEGQVSVRRDPTTQSISTTHLGARATFVPLPRSSVRPTLAAGLARWSGSSVSGVPGFDPLDAPNLLLFEALPGIEGSATPVVNLFARGLVGIPIAGTPVREQETGEPRLQDPPSPTGESGLSLGVQVGLTIRVGPLFKLPEGPSGMEYEEPDL